MPDLTSRKHLGRKFRHILKLELRDTDRTRMSSPIFPWNTVLIACARQALQQPAASCLHFWSSVERGNLFVVLIKANLALQEPDTSTRRLIRDGSCWELRWTRGTPRVCDGWGLEGISIEEPLGHSFSSMVSKLQLLRWVLSWWYSTCSEEDIYLLQTLEFIALREPTGMDRRLACWL